MEIFDSLRRVTSQKNLQNLGTCLKGGGGVGPKPQQNFFFKFGQGGLLICALIYWGEGADYMLSAGEGWEGFS